MEIEDFIRQQGWSAFGIVEFEKVRENLKKHEKNYKDWVAKGYQADMDWLSRMKEDRFHPDRKFPDVKSVIVLGSIYFSGGPNCGPNGGLVARYARGKDYHKVLKKRLIVLSDFLKSEARNLTYQQAGPKFEIETYISVDSGPMVDRVLAETAGLGFFGKNSCIIDPSKGSYFFIASVLTNLELEPTEKKHMPSCGDCMKCIKNCPTGALVSPGKLDARKCISYLTIENKEGIPIELRSKIGNRLFGCDICQEVCPFSIGRAHHQVVQIDKLKGEYGVGESLDLREVLFIKNDEEFLSRFAGTPIMRTKRRGLIRNACVVAGNSGDKTLIPFLENLIQDESDDMINEHALWALNQLN